MRIAFWAASTLAVLWLQPPSAGVKPLHLANGDSITAKGHGSQTILTIANHGKTWELVLDRDETVAPNASPELKLIGESGRRVVILSDTYDSKPGGLSYCQAGQESFLRVLNLGPPPRQTFRIKLKSCRQNLDLAEDGVSWHPKSGILKIHRLPNASNPQRPDFLEYRLQRSGVPKLIVERRSEPDGNLGNRK